MARILVLCPYVPHPPTHGGSIRSRVLLQALSTNHEVHLAAAVADAADRVLLAGCAAELGLRTHELAAVAAPTVSLSTKLRHWLPALRSELLRRRWRTDALRHAAGLQATAPDLVVLDSSFALPLWQASRRARSLLHLHNLEHRLFARPTPGHRPWKERLTRAVETVAIRRTERDGVRRATMTLTVSDEDRRIALQLAPEARVEVVPNSIDLARLPLQPGRQAAPPRQLFVGTFDYPPNQEAVTELVTQHLPVLRQRWPGLRLRLVGRDPNGWLGRLVELAYIEAVGPVADLLPHYAASDAVYLPIRSGGGTRIKILEAFALGLPVLSTAVGIEGLAANDGEHFRAFETPEQGAAALAEVLAGQGALLRTAARELVVAHYSHDAAMRRMRELIDPLL